MIQEIFTLFQFFLGGFCLILALSQLIRSHSVKNILLLGIFLCFAFGFTIPALLNSQYDSMFYYLMGLDIPMLVAACMLIYIYFRDLDKKDFLFTKKDWGHLIPVFISFLSILPILLTPAQEKIAFLDKHYFLIMDEYYPWVPLPGAILVLVYLIQFSMKYFSQIKKTKKDVYFNILIFLLLGVFDCFLVLFSYLLHSPELSQAFYICCALTILWLYFSSQKYQLILQTYYKDGVLIKAKRPLVEETSMKDITSKIEILMKEQRIYTNTKLSLYSLAGQLQISPQQLSYIINEKFGKNFKTYINEYRIEESKKMLMENTYLSLEGIGQKSGFGSHTAFLNFFKQMTHLTPGQYRKTLVHEKVTEENASLNNISLRKGHTHDNA